MMQRIYFFSFVYLTFMTLGGCQGFNPVTDTAGHFLRSNKNAEKMAYLPGFEYLEVEWQGRKAAMALGYRENKGSQVSEYWYSGQGEMLKLLNGRIVQVLGMTQEVRSLSTNTPSWADLLSHRLPVVWSQTKDTMPGYRYGLQEFVISQQVIPTRVETALVNTTDGWVLEEIKSKEESGKTWIYQQKFALANDRVIYSEQCVARDMCFKLKPLGVVVPK